jgi:uncharacterized protein YbjT (DUF2867 family)
MTGEQTMKVLAVGANGRFAGMVVPELKKRGVTVRALIRDNDGERTARENGADEMVIGNLEDPASLRSAVTGVDGVFHINPAFAPHESDMGLAMVEAAKAGGVAKFVFSSVIHPQISTLSNHSAKLPVEEAIYQSGMTFAVLQPAMFMQTLAGGWNGIVKQGRFSLPYSKHAKACYVDYRDVAEAAAIALTDDRLDYGTFELCAPGMLSRLELTAIMSDALGRTIEAGELPFDEWAQTAKIPDGPLREGLQRMYADYDRFGFPGGNALVLRTILNREPRTLTEYIHELAARERKAA